MSGVVTLLTDFGLDDPYVAEVKGRLLTEWARYPEPGPLPAIVDVSHGVPAGDVAAAAWLLERVHAQFPAGTVHLAVVDPGVGTSRPAVAVEGRGQLFVGPGNGLLAFLAGDRPAAAAVRLDNPLYQRGPGGRPAATFHGRDVFAPAAAHLAMGVPLHQVGSAVAAGELAQVLGAPPARPADAGAAVGRPALGRLVWVDRFGNAISDVRRDSRAGEALAGGQAVRIGGVCVPGPVATFAAGPAGGPFWYWGSGGTLEAALRGESAAARLGWRAGMAVEPAAP